MDTDHYLILAEGQFGPQSSKTATNAIRYLPERVVGVLDSAHAGKTAWEVIGLGGAIPVVGTLEAGHHSEVISHPLAFLVAHDPPPHALAAPCAELIRCAVSPAGHSICHRRRADGGE
jgi:hypothetical protein